MNRTDGAGPAGTMRVLAGYSPDERGDDALAPAALVARAADAELTVAHVYPAAWPAHGPGRVDAEWVAYLREQRLPQGAGRRGPAPRRRAAGRRDGTPVERLTSVGTGVEKALRGVAMLPGEILACQSGHDGPLRRVFLGESSGRIVRAAPCPVLVLPRGAVPRRGPGAAKVQVR